jgi:hypothetical protein
MKTKNWQYFLHSGDEVTWNDPDNGICSRTGIIQSIECTEDMAKIVWVGGDYLECFLSELS